ncbi:MAG TPA: hypothetical protein VMO47_05115 [Rhodothermales bacterium]|nr:hypothetical protein [Rhodothermales bacterium]
MLWWYLKQLKSRDVGKRRRAVEHLARTTREKGIAALCDALTDPALEVRQAAEGAVSQRVDEPALRELGYMLSCFWDYEMARARRRASAVVLAGIRGPHQIPIFVKSLQTIRMTNANLASDALDAIPDRVVPELCFSVLGFPDPRQHFFGARLAMVERVGRMTAPPPELLSNALRDENPQVREAAARRLSDLGQAAVPAVTPSSEPRMEKPRRQDQAETDFMFWVARKNPDDMFLAALVMRMYREDPGQFSAELAEALQAGRVAFRTMWKENEGRTYVWLQAM